MQKLLKEDMFVLDLANNHQGDEEHGLNIIRNMGEVAKKHGLQAALKFQFRQLGTFIHPDYKGRDDVKHIPRFESTVLTFDTYKKFTAEVKKQGMLSISTPFDEESIAWIHELDIDIIKVASCSASDKPLLEAIANAGRPVIISTGGLTLSQIDWLVSFFEAKKVDFAIMHCISLYPTPPEQLNLNQIDLLKKRYPEIPIGWSTHEEPTNLDAVKIAYAKGAQLFERHVGMNTDKYKLNGYSSTPDEVDAWMAAYKVAKDSCGGTERSPAPPEEINALRTLFRGVWAKKGIKKGEIIKREDIFFAMPLQEEQLVSGDFSNDIVADRDYEANQPINENIVKSDVAPDDLVYEIMLQVKGMLNNARIFVNKDAGIEISHHYGLERFREFGCVIIDCINREYAKKLLIQLPRQKHPYHLHKKKEETFQLLYGDLEVEVNGQRSKLLPGDTFLVERGQWHKFHTLDGAIFEEVSTTHFNNDSYYEDQKIAKMERSERKTNVDSWAEAFHWRY
ncbi:MAG: sialic acid synthase [Halobacteriovorax sp.]|nr:sialic acid synthase [Halobacteriovorax sp.]|tara:strand:+ start:20892 stop:22415 length:1524 start_codon:yes stop_codon:yes gene_type:complete